MVKEPEVIEGLVQVRGAASRRRGERKRGGRLQQHDLVVSLLPYTFHAAVAKMCIKHGRNLCTSSYVTPELQALDEDAQRAGVTIMNEGRPRSRHRPSARHVRGSESGERVARVERGRRRRCRECIDRIHEMGGKVTSFISFCGGLPAPEASANALRYKFSWSPKGMLLSLMNPARYLYEGKTVDVAGNGAVIDDVFPIDFMVRSRHIRGDTADRAVNDRASTRSLAARLPPRRIRQPRFDQIRADLRH